MNIEITELAILKRKKQMTERGQTMKKQVLKIADREQFTVLYDSEKKPYEAYALYYLTCRPNEAGVYTKRKYLVARENSLRVWRGSPTSLTIKVPSSTRRAGNSDLFTGRKSKLTTVCKYAKIEYKQKGEPRCHRVEAFSNME